MPPHPKPGKPKRIKPSGKAPSHLDNLRRLPCLLSGGPAEAAHIRYADSAHEKPETGAGRKPEDRYCVPLSPLLHRLSTESQHSMNERDWWAQFGVDPLKVAALLWEHRHNPLTMSRIIIMNQPWDQKIRDRIAQIMRNEKPRRKP
jgi:hypothetical protein